MKKRIYCITTALCLVLCIVLCIAFAAVCSKADNSKAVLPEVEITAQQSNGEIPPKRNGTIL